jgi:hypothetical protein
MATDTENETGRNLRSVEALADDAKEEEPETDGTHQLVLPGSGPALSSNIGGKRPNESVFKMSGVSLPISGNVELKKDEEIWVAIPVAIDEVKIKNRRKAREIVGVVRTHTATAIGQPIILDGPPVDE